MKNSYSVINNQERSYNQLKANDGSLVSFEEVNENFVGLNEKSVMKDNLDMDKHRILNLAIPTGAAEPATKQYADAHFFFRDGSHPMTGDLNMNNNRINNLPSPSAGNRPATNSYTENSFSQS